MPAHAPGSTPAFRIPRIRYPRTLESALGLGAIFHLALFLAVPAVTVTPYHLPEARITELVEYQPEIEVLPPPEEVKRPELPRELDITGDADPDVTLPVIGENPFVVAPTRTDAADGGIVLVPDVPPQLLKPVKPEYPALAREAGMEGKVYVEVVIDERGRVISARVLETTAGLTLREAALRAARATLFTPARQGIHAVKVRLVIPFEFRLR